ncbi:chorismate synthase [Candidatus Magnetobacterium casense]|uniref:Chorismate synthase n=1 Tax=Candidatus Magnetobacterium casense TaxID=1455061 RepID=A0ABS6RVA4_9BACT|nr:chorismate synthase [Candidatus Magnetobacterium casensis]MBV6340560.1 chorismate synthase [Candidatus Magnetobacterium casensis]
MDRLKISTAGESHGKALTGIIEGIPAGLPIEADTINTQLHRRQQGHGRGGRMKIEQDQAEILSGVRWGKTLASPIALKIDNRDWENWQKGMSSLGQNEGSIPPVTRARPGHADLAGCLKHGFRDIRNVLERSSARETAMRVALGAVCKTFLAQFGISIGSFVVRTGGAGQRYYQSAMNELGGLKDIGNQLIALSVKADQSPVRCPFEEDAQSMIEAIDEAIERGDTIGGVFEVFAVGLPVGLGSHVQWDKRLDGQLAQAIMSIQAVKGVECGLGFDLSQRFGSRLMDEILYSDETGFYRQSNFAGGLEGGMTNGMPLLMRAIMKPIPTQRKPLNSIDIVTKQPKEAAYERSDVCAVAACSVIAEAMIAFVLADAILCKFGGDCIDETIRNYNNYLTYLKEF